MTIALITARGGSVRLPRKNILPFCGHPLVAWSIIQARCSKYIDDVYLTTDDEEIAKIGKQYGAKIIMRPVYGNDYSAGYVLKLALEKLSNEELKIDDVVLMLPTSPVKRPYDLDELILAYRKSNTKSMEVFCPERECFIYENYSSLEDRQNNCFSLRPIVMNKSWRYSIGGIGWSIVDCKYFIDEWNKKSPLDSIIDEEMQNEQNEFKLVYGYAVEPWQMFETDYENYFRICELLMEEFVLRNQGMKVYLNYARGNGKIVKIEDDKQLDLIKQYAGNINQIRKDE